MKVCEIEGRIRGCGFETERGFLFNGKLFREYEYGVVEEEIQFPFTNGKPHRLNLDKVINKRFRLTVEIIEDEDSKED